MCVVVKLLEIKTCVLLIRLLLNSAENLQAITTESRSFLHSLIVPPSPCTNTFYINHHPYTGHLCSPPYVYSSRVKIALFLVHFHACRFHRMSLNVTVLLNSQPLSDSRAAVTPSKSTSSFWEFETWTDVCQRRSRKKSGHWDRSVQDIHQDGTKEYVLFLFRSGHAPDESVTTHVVFTDHLLPVSLLVFLPLLSSI